MTSLKLVIYWEMGLRVYGVLLRNNIFYMMVPWIKISRFENFWRFSWFGCWDWKFVLFDHHELNKFKFKEKLIHTFWVLVQLWFWLWNWGRVSVEKEGIWVQRWKKEEESGGRKEMELSFFFLFFGFYINMYEKCFSDIQMFLITHRKFKKALSDS